MAASEKNNKKPTQRAALAFPPMTDLEVLQPPLRIRQVKCPLFMSAVRDRMHVLLFPVPSACVLLYSQNDVHVSASIPHNSPSLSHALGQLVRKAADEYRCVLIYAIAGEATWHVEFFVCPKQLVRACRSCISQN